MLPINLYLGQEVIKFSCIWYFHMAKHSFLFRNYHINKPLIYFRVKMQFSQSSIFKQCSLGLPNDVSHVYGCKIHRQGCRVQIESRKQTQTNRDRDSGALRHFLHLCLLSQKAAMGLRDLGEEIKQFALTNCKLFLDF